MDSAIMNKVVTAYRIKSAEYAFEVPELDLFQFADILGDEDMSFVRRQPRTNESMLERWTPSRCELANEYKEGLPVPDVSLWGSYLLLSEEAYCALLSLLSADGEFLPLQVGFMQMYIFVPLQFAEEDMTQTLKHYEDGFECGLERLVFEPQSIAHRAVFKSKMYGTQGIFATSRFKERCEAHDLKGLVFDTDLAGTF